MSIQIQFTWATDAGHPSNSTADAVTVDVFFVAIVRSKCILFRYKVMCLMFGVLIEDRRRWDNNDLEAAAGHDRGESIGSGSSSRT